MDKQTAINLLGGTPKKAAEAMGYQAVQTIYMWPDVLPRSVAERINGVLASRKTARRRVKPKPLTA